MTAARPINRFLVENGFFIAGNPAVSPDLTLDFGNLLETLRGEAAALSALDDPARAAREARAVTLYPQSELGLLGRRLFVVESRRTGDAALVAAGTGPMPFSGVAEVSGAAVVPLTWENLVTLKNALYEEDPETTVFPRATGLLAQTSLGIGARFTTLHWPAVAWTMRALRLPLTANQNSIPRELVFNVDAMLEGRLSEVPFPFIGGAVPEGHQGQSVQGMSHAAIVTYLKLGFHRHRIPWGFNADHQPIGGRFDAIERELVEGSLFASYITYDLSPELSLAEPIQDAAKLEERFGALVAPEVHAAVTKRLGELGLAPNPIELKRLLVYVAPAMEKMRRRDALYAQIRGERFSSAAGQAFYKELSIDELPGQTTRETLAVCLAMAEALGVTFNFVAPNIGFQKNFPYGDNDDLKRKVTALYDVARKFGVSFGFHSGSGKSADNYRVLGEATGQRLEIKTSGRYTYEMGVALSRSPEPGDQALWRDWYAFTRRLALEGAFSSNETQRKMAREFIVKSFETERRPTEGLFETPDRLEAALGELRPSADHMFWFEYNFLYVLAAGGSAQRLGDHGPEGYRQRARFYSISEAGRLLFAQNVARYILFLAETTGIRTADDVAAARARLDAYTKYGDLLDDIAR